MTWIGWFNYLEPSELLSDTNEALHGQKSTEFHDYNTYLDLNETQRYVHTIFYSWLTVNSTQILWNIRITDLVRVQVNNWISSFCTKRKAFKPDSSVTLRDQGEGVSWFQTRRGQLPGKRSMRWAQHCKARRNLRCALKHLPMVVLSAIEPNSRYSLDWFGIWVQIFERADLSEFSWPKVLGHP